MKFIEYLETILNKITRGWKGQQVNIASFAKQPFDQAITYITLGLSHHLFDLPHERTIRIELLFTTYENYAAEPIVSCLEDISNSLLSEHQAPLRGEVIKLAVPIIPFSSLNYVYVTVPSTVFEESLDIYTEAEPPVILALLIPIYEEEAQFIQQHGWSKFEDILEVVECDIFNLDRVVIIDPLINSIKYK